MKKFLIFLIIEISFIVISITLGHIVGNHIVDNYSPYAVEENNMSLVDIHATTELFGQKYRLFLSDNYGFRIDQDENGINLIRTNEANFRSKMSIGMSIVSFLTLNACFIVLSFINFILDKLMNSSKKEKQEVKDEPKEKKSKDKKGKKEKKSKDEKKDVKEDEEKEV